MSDFWNNTVNQIENGVSQFLQNEIDRHIAGPAKQEPAPDTSKSVLEQVQAQMKKNMVLFVIVGLFIVGAVLLSSGGRRAKR
nr:hypothetical protein CKG001_17620 [Bdellovibrio sp. CKG001]